MDHCPFCGGSINTRGVCTRCGIGIADGALEARHADINPMRTGCLWRGRVQPAQASDAAVRRPTRQLEDTGEAAT
jgi:hypothetical protein